MLKVNHGDQIFKTHVVASLFLSPFISFSNLCAIKIPSVSFASIPKVKYLDCI